MICYHAIRFIIIINPSVSASYTDAQCTVASFFECLLVRDGSL